MASLTINMNESGGCSPACSPGTYSVRAHYNESDAGHVFGTFSTREAAEKCLLTLAGRTDVVKATIEGGA